MDGPDTLVFVILPILGIGALVLLAVGYKVAYEASRYKTLQVLANRWGGRAIQGGWLEYSQAELRIAGTLARLQFALKGGRKNKRTVTELTIHFPDPSIRLEVYPQTFVDEIRKFLGMQDIELGIRSFDDAFVIQGNHPALIREYLSLPAQAAIQKLAQGGIFLNLYLILGGGTLRVTKNGDIHGEAELTRFVEAFEALFVALTAARSLGIEILPTSAPSRVVDSHCQVCGENLQGNIVYCTSCQTPHHLDCWQYIGACSVYACGQKRYRTHR